MTRRALWREFESGEGAVARMLRAFALAGGAVCVCAALLPMRWPQQAALALALAVSALWMHRASRARWATLILMTLSAFATLRYAAWRVASVVAFLWGTGTGATTADAVSVWALLLAEGYAVVVLFLGYVQRAWPMRRPPAPLPDDPAEWPAVDVLIPTLNEPLELVRDTALAAMNMDWPGDKLKIWVLDDGTREDFRAFAAEAGIGYLSRDENTGAKAGNINHALDHTNAPFVAVFDCDQAPARSFLQLTMGWMVRDARLALVQTPHRFYSADPFERNLGASGAPGEEQLFHGAIQDGNDLWNAASFSGSCAVLRRAALDEIGGIATETVTEDVHTSLRLQKRGWKTAYINLPQSAGLATERLRGYVQQRVRWARGMMQVLRLERPWSCEGLRWQQRLCYLNSAAYFLCALPRLVFLAAPAAYLICGRTALPGLWAALLAYALPHLVLAALARMRAHGRARQAFWNEIYETVMAPYVVLPTLAALLWPRRANFKVTEKGGVVEHEFYDVRTALPYLLLLGLNLLALICAGLRFADMHSLAMSSASGATTWASRHFAASNAGAVWINVAWALFNVAVLCAAAGAARESAQRRRSVRIAVVVPADVIFADGTLAQGVTCDLSRSGVRARAREASNVRTGDAVKFILPLLDGAVTLRATVVSAQGGEVRARFGDLGLREAEALTMLLYSRADAWLGWGEGAAPVSAVRGALRALRLALRGVRRILGGASGRKTGERDAVASIVPLLAAVLLLGGAMKGDAQTAVQSAAPHSGAGATYASTKGAAQQPPEKDLARLPQMFAGGDPSVPVGVVFAAPPTAKQMQAAAVVASWLGVMLDRPVRFAASVGTMPAGDAIFLASGPSSMLTALGAGAVSGATVLLAGNPSNGASSVLVLSGGDDDGVLTAAIALALQSGMWHGPVARIDAMNRPPARAPDDAPRWLSTDHVATLTQAALSGGTLQIDSARPVTATLRLPPDLDYEDGFGRQGGYQQNLALHLDYRYNAVPLGEGSTLDVFVNGAYISSTPMPHTENASEVLETIVPVPVADLRPGDNEFSFRFSFHAARNDAPASNLMGAVLKDSYLDIGGIPHWARLPELALFARAGYPFTRRADLADTAIVLPSAPTAHEMEAALTLISRMGAQTGLPAVNVTVTDPSAVDSNTGKDLLVLGTPQDQPAIGKLDEALPVEIGANGLRVREVEGIFGGLRRGLMDRVRRWRGQNDEQRFGEIESVGEVPDTTVEEMEWPRHSARTAVVIALRDDAAATTFAGSMSGRTADGIADSVSVLNGGQFRSYRLGGDAYRVGGLSPWIRVEFLLEDSPWTVAAVVVIFCVLISVLVQARLRRRARERLQMLV